MLNSLSFQTSSLVVNQLIHNREGTTSRLAAKGFASCVIMNPSIIPNAYVFSITNASPRTMFHNVLST